jgi:hypothetical protein
LVELVDDFEKIWEEKDESDNFQQRHDIGLAKEVVRPSVYETIREQVTFYSARYHLPIDA